MFEMFDILPWMQLASNYLWIPISTTVLYIIGIYYGVIQMNKREAYKLTGLLTIWNLCLTLFSAAGFYVLYSKTYESFLKTNLGLCGDPEFRYGFEGLWIMLFAMSKFPELIDTAFLILRKKPVNFLHVYHHASVLLYCWYAFSLHSNSGIYYATMNFFVHTWMYFYYFLTSLNLKPRWGNIITKIQILQMFIGFFINLYGFYVGCEMNESLFAGNILYGSYIFLFVHYYLKRY